VTNLQPTDETHIAAFLLAKDLRVSLTFDGNLVHVEALAENGRREVEVLTRQQAAEGKTLDVRLAMMADRLEGDQHSREP
jgi:hypothetical protein